MKQIKTDVLVIGSGPAGSSIAYNCAKAGKKVVIADRLFGGTCALSGCTPKKAMEAITSSYWEALKMQKAGFPSFKKSVDWHQLTTHKAKFTALVPAKTKQKFKKNGIKPIEGYAEFIDPHTVQVDQTQVKAEKIVIATGARPTPLDIPGGHFSVHNDQFFSLDQLPKRVVIIGGGYIGFEMSHIMAACGSDVTIISNEEMPLSNFDKDLVADLLQATLAKGIKVRLGFEARKIEKSGKTFVLKCKRTNGKKFSCEADLVIHAAGRMPNTDKLNIRAAGLELNDQKGIQVNKFLQSRQHKHIFALGDVTGRLPFTETANYEAKIVTHNLLNKKRQSVKYTGVPIGVFTYPKLTTVGQNEHKLKQKGIPYKAGGGRLDNSFYQRTTLNKFARYKTVVHKKTGRILGASIFGARADEMINLFAMAIQNKMTENDLKGLLLLYPTAGQEVKGLV